MAVALASMFDALFGDAPPGVWGWLNHRLWVANWSDPFAAGYATLNLVEALFWLGIAAWVFARHCRGRGGRWEVAYALAFVLFGLSDVAESFAVPPALIAAKGLILAGIITLRSVVVRRYYPGQRM